jgi:hypothetical protein
MKRKEKKRKETGVIRNRTGIPPSAAVSLAIR